MYSIRKATIHDQDGVWKILEPIIKSGDTLVHATDSSKEKIISLYFAEDKYLYVAEIQNKIAGLCYIKQNQPDLGSHIANAGYMVHPDFRGKGLADGLCRFSLIEAKKLGFSAMQFNIVVSTNETAVKIWKKCGFQIIGILPEAFQHAVFGLTDAYIMYQKL